jgi:hypothetical protein
MKIITDTDQFRGGWYIGNFEPSVYKTSAAEVSYKTHYKDEYWAKHYHLASDEINYLLEGEMLINGQKLSAPCIFIIYRGEVSDPKFLTDVKIIVVKIPGVLNDKYEITESNNDNRHSPE